MKNLIVSLVLLSLAGCASSQFNKECGIDADGQQRAMENISAVLRSDFKTNADSYIKEGFEPQTIYGGNDYCTYMVAPWRPITSELIWDGTLAFRIDKETYEVLGWRRADD
jgi:hypothetical protein